MNRSSGATMPDEERPRCVVFDLDGLMFNTEELYVLVDEELLSRRGKDFTRDLFDSIIGRKAPVALQTIIDWHGLNESLEELQAESEAIFARLMRSHLAPMPGMLDLMAILDAAKVPKAIATSSSREHLERLLTVSKSQLRFQFSLSAEDVLHGKPYPDIYLHAARLFGQAPSQLLVLEDSDNGCQAAVDAGAFVVAVPNKQTQHHGFRGVRFVAETLADIRICAALGLQ